MLSPFTQGFKQQRRRRLRERYLKSEFPLLQTWHAYFLNNFSRVDTKERKPSTKREIRHYRAVVVQWLQRNIQKSVLLVQIQTYCYWRSRCRRRRLCVRVLMCIWWRGACVYKEMSTHLAVMMCLNQRLSYFARQCTVPRVFLQCCLVHFNCFFRLNYTRRKQNSYITF